MPVRTARNHHSAGAVVLDGDHCLVMRRGREWIFPKGHIEAGERAEDAARREVLEETGIRIEIGAALGSTRYGFKSADGHWNRKRVDWFVGRRVGGELRLEPIFDEASFVSQADALARLTFRADRAIARLAFDRPDTRDTGDMGSSVADGHGPEGEAARGADQAGAGTPQPPDPRAG